MVMTILLILVVVGFAWNLGVHYTGAVMGMPYAARSISLWPALILIGILTILGATFASHGVEATVGQQIIDSHLVTIPDALVIVLAAGALTLLYNYWKIPTSTIQILVFCVVGVGLAGNIPIAWQTIGKLAIVWVCAPVVAFGLGFLFTRLLDLIIPTELARAQTQALAQEDAQALNHRSWFARAFPGVALPQEVFPLKKAPVSQVTLFALRWLPFLLVCVGMAASFVLGANDVSNATGAFILTHLFSFLLAGFIGGVAMAVGTLTWGRRILNTVAFDVVKMDLTMASAAQGVQALVVLIAVTLGLFTSMNQALIGAMAGTGFARGRETVQRKQMLGILRGWLIGPLSGLTLAVLLEWLVRFVLHLR
ncbi:anion permease [Dictyobacter sp. S3.2.2.5]|uniref:Phosphate transporter n=1 Tax=Dictyobacter halimunensis TaxID=3026934 RepID=A0ABQ6FRE0_9CHLR|nr:anion permease [Dictyobacter sp. S3.2.2.5]